MSDPLTFHLISPACDINLDFHCPSSKIDQLRDENYVIVDIIKWIIDEIDELKKDLDLSNALKAVNYSSFASLIDLSKVYNEVISKYKKVWTENAILPDSIGKRAKIPLLKFIVSQCYNRSVREPEKLNQYPPFSAQVYGETSFELVLNIINEVKIKPNETFIDLGSGVGQVVLQIAGLIDVKLCYGIEKAEYPATCASRLEKEYRRWMDFFGKKYSPFTIAKGDFLASDIHDLIISADVIFANNFAFGPEVDHQLKLKFQNLKEGTRIISSKAFCPLNFRISDRNLGDIGSIMHVTTLSAISNAVSWTDKPFSYFIHTIDRKILEDYFYRSKNPKLRNESDNTTSKRDRSRRGNSNPVSDVCSLRKSLLIRKKIHKLNRKRTSSAKPILTNKPEEEFMNEENSIEHKPPRKSSSCHSMNNTPTNSCSSSSEFPTNDQDESSNLSAKSQPPENSRSRQSKPIAGQLREKSMIDKAFRPRSKEKTKRAEKRKSNSNLDEDLASLHEHTSESIDQWVGNSSEPILNETPYNEPKLVSAPSKYPRVTLEKISEVTSHAMETQDDLINGHSNDCTPIALQQYLELCRRIFMMHFKKTQTPNYSSDLKRQIEEERERNKKIKAKLSACDESIKKLNEEGAQLLKKCAAKLGIKISPPVQFFTEARKMIKTRASLEQKIETMISEINELSAANGKLKNHAMNRNQLPVNLPTQQYQQQLDPQTLTAIRVNGTHPQALALDRNRIDLLNNSIEFSCPPELSPLTKKTNTPGQNTSLNDSQIPLPPELTLMNLTPTKKTHQSPPNLNSPFLGQQRSMPTLRTMHSSMQDIISQEISNTSKEISQEGSERLQSESQSPSDLPKLAKETTPSPPPQIPGSDATPPPALDHCLPPRKRHWESQLKQSATAGS